MKAKVIGAMVAALLAMVSTQASGTIYDAAKDLTQDSITAGTNPNGVWSYGYRNTVASTDFTHLSINGPFPDGVITRYGGNGLQGWYGDLMLPGLPFIMKNMTVAPVYFGDYREVIFSPGQLGFHPSSEGSEYAVLRWTAPSSATADLDVTFDSFRITGSLDYYYATTDVHVVKNGYSLFDADLTFNSNTKTYSVDGLKVIQGDTIDIIVGSADNGSTFDTTAVSAVITVPDSAAVPEPASVVCGIIGLGMIGGYVKKRRSLFAGVGRAGDAS